MSDEQHTLLATEPYRKALDGIVRGQPVVEFGCGTGVLTQILLDVGARTVLGYEIVPGLCKVQDPRFVLREADYTQAEGNDLPVNAAIVANPAYSTLPWIVKNILPYHRNAILMIPGRALEEFKAKEFEVLFVLDGPSFNPPASGDHYVVKRGFSMEHYPFIDLHHEVAQLWSTTVAARIDELSKLLPSVSLCALGGFPFRGDKPSLKWGGLYVHADTLQSAIGEALGLSAVLTYTNRKNHSLEALGALCAERKETWAYHWMTATLVFARHSPAVHLAFARDSRFKLGWAVEKEYTGKLFGVWTASASLKDWVRFTSKKDDPSFDMATRAAMSEAHELLTDILP
jgi:hypothetical protein